MGADLSLDRRVLFDAHVPSDLPPRRRSYSYSCVLCPVSGGGSCRVLRPSIARPGCRSPGLGEERRTTPRQLHFAARAWRRQRTVSSILLHAALHKRVSVGLVGKAGKGPMSFGLTVGRFLLLLRLTADQRHR